MIIFSKLLFIGSIMLVALLIVSCGSDQSTSDNYSSIYRSNFESNGNIPSSGIYDGWGIQANYGDITVVDDPAGRGGKSLRVSMRKAEDYSHVANGVPRAELSRIEDLNRGREYRISWKIFIPADYQFDTPAGTGNPEIIIQIHHNDDYHGSPPFALGFDGSSYFYASDNGHGGPEVLARFGDAAADRGRWTSWRLHYLMSDADNGVTELYRDNQLVQSQKRPNAYPGLDAYLKIGIYKWAWITDPSTVTERTLYYDDIQIEVKR